MSSFYPRLLVFIQFLLIALIMISSKSIFSSILYLTIFIIGLAIGIWALRYNKLGNFNIQPNMKNGAELVTTGIYRYVRHPMYLSVIVMMLAFLLADLSWLLWIYFITLIGILYLKASREENIWMMHNPEYESYRADTKLLIPFVL